MIRRFFKFIALLWYADEYGWPDQKQDSPSDRSAPSIGSTPRIDRTSDGARK
jgi:hypothetical protein